MTEFMRTRKAVIRRATVEDLPAIVRMSVRFIAESSYRGLVAVNVEQLEALARFLLEHGAVFVAETGIDVVGMIGVTVVPHMVSGELVAGEVAWWMEPEYRTGFAGARLLRAAERWAVDAGAGRFQMIAPAGNRRVGEFYRRRGYLEIETVYQRELEVDVVDDGRVCGYVAAEGLS